jgi:hypothetical protein
MRILNNFSACIEHWKKTSSRQNDFKKYKTRAVFLSENENAKDTKISSRFWLECISNLETFLGHSPNGEAKPPGFHSPKKYVQ